MKTLEATRWPAVALCGLLVLAACERPPAVPQEPLPLVEATIGGIQEAITSGRTTCHAVVAGYLERIKAYDQSTELNAIVVINPRALARADEIDTSIQTGEKLGPLFCAPLLVKDNFDTHDMVTTGGSISLKDNLPPDDAFMVRKVREADAIVIAKTNMAEWAFSPRETRSSSYGRTANAYARDRVPAGSSGGTASGVAASFGVAGLGSDTGNSIRGPSSHLALFGIRSTLGLTSRDGVIPLFFDRDVAGPMARTVEDGARVFNVVAGYDPADPYTELGKGKREADYTAFLDANGLRGARLGVLGALTYTDEADPQITAIFETALTDLEAAGATLVRDFTIPNLRAHMDDDTYCPRFRYDMYRYLKSLGDAAPYLDVTKLVETGEYTQEPEAYAKYMRGGLESFRRRPLEVPPGEWEKPCPDYAEHPARQAFLREVVDAMDAAGVEAILYPTWTNPPAHIDRAFEEYKGDNSQLIAPDTGMPAVTVPMGTSYGNLPAGLQILGRPYSEGLLIQYAYAYEQATHHRRPPPGFPELHK